MLWNGEDGNRAKGLCGDCPPVGYPTDETRCGACPFRVEIKTAWAKANDIGRPVSFVADDGCEVTVTPNGTVFYNAADWF